MTDTYREMRDLSDDELLAQINRFDPYDVEFVRRYRALLAAKEAAEADLRRQNARLKTKGGTADAPTQWAYDRACKARDSHKARAEVAEAKLAVAIPFVEIHVRDLKRRFEETDDGVAYQDWQDARAALDQIQPKEGKDDDG